MSDDETYEIPLQDQRVFGAGIKRKRVQFVPSSSATPSVSTPPRASSGRSIGDLYLSMVLPKETPAASSLAKAATQIKTEVPDTHAANDICEVCRLSILATATDSSESKKEVTSRQRPHEASLAHQVCLTHSHPPSHLDRNRKGLAYLSSYGWDPDSRLGLGAQGQGIQFPIKTKAKDDKLGLGVVLPREAERRRKEKPQKLDAGKIRKMYENDKKKTDKLREMFYQSEDVSRYLGGG
ncbi:G-patch domain-containing protein [Phlyctema vagabunda]|uniref:G-patch domain-containing protein n=1 Tax=Phlyctema vagabunda TaxID=108571 RepID=A0ABR4P9M7_9HELO